MIIYCHKIEVNKGEGLHGNLIAVQPNKMEFIITIDQNETNELLNNLRFADIIAWIISQGYSVTLGV